MLFKKVKWVAVVVKAEKDQQIWTSIYPKVVVHKQKDYLFATQPKADGKGLQPLEVQTLWKGIEYVVWKGNWMVPW